MVAEDVGAKRKIEQLLSERDESLQDVKKTLQGLFYRFFLSFFSPLSSLRLLGGRLTKFLIFFNLFFLKTQNN